MSVRVIHFYRTGIMTGCGILADGGLSGADHRSATAIVWDFNVWRWLPRQAQCKRCWRGKKQLCAPAELVAGIEAMMLEFQRLGGEHACWHDDQRVVCTCGSYSWTHPTAHAEACYESLLRYLTRRRFEDEARAAVVSLSSGEFSTYARRMR